VRPTLRTTANVKGKAKMKASITSTDSIVNIGGGISARVWEGVSEKGVPFVAYIAVVQVKRAAANEEFERELNEFHKDPDAATLRAIDLRMIL